MPAQDGFHIQCPGSSNPISEWLFQPPVPFTGELVPGTLTFQHAHGPLYLAEASAECFFAGDITFYYPLGCKGGALCPGPVFECPMTRVQASAALYGTHQALLIPEDMLPGYLCRKCTRSNGC